MNDNLTPGDKDGPHMLAASKLIDEGAKAVAIVYFAKDGSLQLAYKISEREFASSTYPVLLCGISNLAQHLSEIVMNCSDEVMGNA